MQETVDRPPRVQTGLGRAAAGLGRGSPRLVFSEGRCVFRPSQGPLSVSGFVGPTTRGPPGLVRASVRPLFHLPKTQPKVFLSEILECNGSFSTPFFFFLSLNRTTSFVCCHVLENHIVLFFGSVSWFFLKSSIVSAGRIRQPSLRQKALH